MNKNALIAGLLVGTASILAAAEEQPSVFPKPQQMEIKEGFTLAEEVTVSIRTKDSQGEEWAQLPADNEGAYALRITPGKLQVWANSATGAHYAKQTLTQIGRAHV